MKVIPLKSRLLLFLKRFITCSCCFFILWIFLDEYDVYSMPYNQSIPLQPLIDEASEGETIVLSSGTYAGPVIVDKSVTLQGDSTVTLVNKEAAPAISIQADGVSLGGFIVKQEYVAEFGAIQVSGKNTTLSGLSVHTQGYGIVLRKAFEGVIQNNEVIWSGPEQVSSAQKGNGIDLYATQYIRITDNVIIGMRDGIYMENSWDTEVKDNTLTRTRYAIHCMYLVRPKITNNTGEHNITGAMIMGVQEATVLNNSFRKQSANVHSQGIMMYDVQNSKISHNTLEGNRVGLYIQESSGNEISQNDVVRNFVGVQLLDAEGNELHSNRFVSNVIEAQAVESRNNIIRNNYWDTFQGLDLNRDGASEMAYAINPFYQELVRRKAPFQLFFQSPGMLFLSELHTEGRANWTTDISPLMRLDTNSIAMEKQNPSQRIMPWLGALLMLVSACSMIYLGGEQR